MSGTERSYRIALRAFPKAYREERGDEIVATILEGGDRWRLRELFGLFWAGVGQRAFRAGGETTAGLVRAGIRLGAFALLWLEAKDKVRALLLYAWREHTDAATSFPSRYAFFAIGATLVGILILLALSRGLWAAPLVITCVWIVLVRSLVPDDYEYRTPTELQIVTPARVQIVGWTLLLLPLLVLIIARPRRGEPRDLHSPLWAVAAVVWGALEAWHYGLIPNHWLGFFALALLLWWLVLGWRDLRLSIALSTLAMYWCLEEVGFKIMNPGAQYVGFPWELVILPLIFVLPIAIGFTGRRVRA